MQFTRLRLDGFKSFVDPAEIVIAPGLTGVVGPNGCGKSNLLEALRWVMGENRPTAMRGEGMEDVIFNGSETRPARNSASVEVMIDNSQRLAPAAFNTDDTLEISRRITRDIGSAFTVNGKTVRARDVAMLFADASTGAHSPALVRQGQIAELINAKPKARRRILEEAAGISGLYQRRHEAELKLNAAETNLARVADLIEQLDSQLRSLERQAGQARRYREIAAQLRRAEAVLLFLRWQAADAERAEAEAALAAGTRTAAAAESEAQAAARVREAAEAGMPPLRDEANVAAAIHQRLSLERDQIAEREARAQAEIDALAARARQLGQDLEREETLARDADTSARRLDAEEGELNQSATGHDAALAEAQDAARAASEALSAEEAALDRLSEEAHRLAARSAAAERRRDEARAALDRIDGDIARAGEAEAALGDEIDRRESVLTEARAADEAARAEAAEAEAALEAAEAARAQAQEAEAEARAAVSAAEGEVAALDSEVTALERLIARDSGEAAQLIDRVTVAPGFEAALGAVLGDDLRAGEVSERAASGWATLPAYDAARPLPAGAEPLAPHVEAPPALARRLVHTGLVAAEAGDALQPGLAPGQRLVSSEGDLWRWDGYRLRASDASSSAALRLEQRNRLTALKASLAERETARATTAEAHAEARTALDATTRREAEARAQRRATDHALAEAARSLSKAESELEMDRGRRDSQRHALALRQDERAEAEVALAEAEAALAEAGDVGEARAAVESKRAEVDEARSAMLGVRARADELRREGLARDKRLAEIARERRSWADRRESAGTRMRDLERRISETAEARTAADGVPAALAAKREKLAIEIETAETRRRAAADALAEGETRLREAEAAARETERAASDRRETRARLEARLESTAARREEAEARIREEAETTPAGLRESIDGADDLPAPDAAETEVQRLRRQRDALGAVNLRAEDDASEVRTERDRIGAERDDLEAAIQRLRTAIAELNREGRERIIAAFEQVNYKFARLFRHLFGGGEARLIMVESDDPLDAGLEILCQPPGKKLSTLSLLSGGEQTLTALSLIFAVFLSNPAPICVLDEVDAPLDDSNVTRFCELLDEMVRLTDTRFLIITHHAITMSRMDRLFGVTMVERGVSRMVSVDLNKAEELALA